MLKPGKREKGVENVSYQRPRFIGGYLPASVVLNALAHLAQCGNDKRHTRFLVPAMGHLIGSPDTFVLQMFDMAVAISSARRSAVGLESMLLTGTQTAILKGDWLRAQAGVRLLRSNLINTHDSRRPIIFFDRSSNLMTIVPAHRFDRTIRASLVDFPLLLKLGLATPLLRTMSNQEEEDEKTKAYINKAAASVGAAVGLGIVVYVNVVTDGAPILIDAFRGKGALNLAPISAGAAIGGLLAGPVIGFVYTNVRAVWREMPSPWSGTIKVTQMGITGRFANGLVSPKGSSGSRSGGTEAPTSGAGTASDNSRITPDDVGFRPGDFRGPAETEDKGPGPTGPGTGGPRSGDSAGGGIAVDGEPVVISTDGETSYVTFLQDGGSISHTANSDGSYTITERDKDGNITSQTTIQPEPADPDQPQDDDGEAGLPAPDDNSPGGPAGFPNWDDDNPGGPAGMPTPEGDGPWGPAAIRVDEYPVPDGPGIGSPLSRGHTFLLSGQVFSRLQMANGVRDIGRGL